MAVGFPTNKADVDSRAGFLALTLRDTLNGVDLLKAWLDGKDDAALTALGYQAADITLLRAAFVDLAKLGAISHGQATQPAASDFFFNAKRLTGLS